MMNCFTMLQISDSQTEMQVAGGKWKDWGVTQLICKTEIMMCLKIYIYRYTHRKISQIGFEKMATPNKLLLAAKK